MKYIVESALHLEMFTTDEPDQAVAAFLNMHEMASPVTVYVADYIGEFYREMTIKRQPPRLTRPDGPNAMTKAGPTNIK